MYVVTGASGQTGSHVVKTLLERDQPVRALVRREEQAASWRQAGAEAIVLDLADQPVLAEAFSGASGVYLMNPPVYGAPDIFAAAAAVHAAGIAAAEQAGVLHVVALSSVGAQHERGTGNILTTRDLEQRLARSRIAHTVLRAANFMENWSWSLKLAVEAGILPSMFVPVSRALPMVSAADIGRTAADLLVQGRQAPQLVEMHGPRDYSPEDAAVVLTRLLDKPVQAVATPQEKWSDAFRATGFSISATDAFCEMYRGFNDGLVAFSGNGLTLRGSTWLETVLDLAVMERGAK